MRKTDSISCGEVIRRRRSDLNISRGYRSLCLRLILVAVIGFFLLTHVFFITQMNGTDMYPALKDGDLLIGYRLQKQYVKDDIVVYQAQNETHVGRVLARTGDAVTIDPSGALLVNGTVQSGDILYPTYPRGDMEFPFVVPEGYVFLLGDYRTKAVDSRDFGAIPLEAVDGKIITILRRRGL